MLKSIFPICLVCSLWMSIPAAAQQTYTWVNTLDGNFRQGTLTNRWFNAASGTTLTDEPIGTGIILLFNNNSQANTVNNVPGTYTITRIEFAGNTITRNISGNDIKLTGTPGIKPGITNQSTEFHIINCNLEGDGNPAYPLELNAAASSLVFNGGINNVGGPINFMGSSGRSINVNGVITGTGDLEIKQNVLVVLNALNTYTGLTYLSAGTARVSTNIFNGTNGAFGNNLGNLFLNGGALQINTPAVSRPFTISATNSGIDAFGQARTVSAPINLPAGSANLNLGGNFVSAQTGQNLTLSGAISNDPGATLSLTKTGNSTVILSGNNTFSGPLIVQAGRLTISNETALPANTNLQLQGGIFHIGSVTPNSAISVGTLSVNASSGIDLGNTNIPFELVFNNSSTSFTGNLTIYNWSVMGGKKISFTNTTNISALLSQISFASYGPGAILVNGNELWPANLYYTQTSGSGNFTNPASWLGGMVPPAGSSIVIQNGFSLTLDAPVSLKSIDCMGTLVAGNPNSLALTPDFCKISNNGVITVSGGAVSFNGNNAYLDGTGSFTFQDLQLNGTCAFRSSITVNGVLQLNPGTVLTGLPPVYGAGSTLIYNTGGTYNRNNEWSNSTGAGFPVNVMIANNTSLNCMTNGSPSGTFFGCANDLTIQSGSALTIGLMALQTQIGGNLLLNGILSASSAGSWDVFISGNWSRSTSGSFIHNNRALYFIGAKNSIIQGPVGGESFFAVRIYKSSPAFTVTLNSPLTIVNSGFAGFELNTGIVVSSPANPLIFSAGGTFSINSLPSVNSFISGPVRKIIGTATSFTFPVGKLIGTERHYRPLTISGATANSGHSYTAEFQRSNPYLQGTISAAAAGQGLSTISRCEYWDLVKSPGASNVNVTISWSNNSAGRSQCGVGAYVTNTNFLWVVPYANGEWGDQNPAYFGRSSISGSQSVSPFLSFITWNAAEGIDNYEKFVLGSTDWRFNPLPFDLLKFEAQKVDQSVELNWAVNGNQNQVIYFVEHSFNGIHFKPLTTQPATPDLTTASYSYLHTKPARGFNYYRILATDNQGETKYSHTIRLFLGTNGTTPEIFPNPVTGNEINLLFPGSVPGGQYSITVLSTGGKTVASQVIRHKDSQGQYRIPLPEHLPQGIYFLQISGDKTNPVLLKFMKN